MARRKAPTYDWAQALINVASSKESDLPTLVKEAGLDPLAGDVTDIDLSGLDLSGQDLSGWDLRHAKWNGATVRETKLIGAKFDHREIVRAKGWQAAKIDEVVLEEMSLADYSKFLDQFARAVSADEQNYVPVSIREVLYSKGAPWKYRIESSELLYIIRRTINKLPARQSYPPAIRSILKAGANRTAYDNIFLNASRGDEDIVITIITRTWEAVEQRERRLANREGRSEKDWSRPAVLRALSAKRSGKKSS